MTKANAHSDKHKPTKAELQEQVRKIQKEVRKVVGDKRSLVDEFLAEKHQAPQQ